MEIIPHYTSFGDMKITVNPCGKCSYDSYGKGHVVGEDEWTRLHLQTIAEDLEWEFSYAVFRHKGQFGSIDLYYKLVVLSGMDIVRTISYSVDFPNLLKDVAGWKPDAMVVNKGIYKAEKHRFPGSSNTDQFFVEGASHKFQLTVKLLPNEDAQGRAVVANSICRLYNNDDLADVELHCGKSQVKAHKEWWNNGHTKGTVVNICHWGGNGCKWPSG